VWQALGRGPAAGWKWRRPSPQQLPTAAACALWRPRARMRVP